MRPITVGKGFENEKKQYIWCDNRTFRLIQVMKNKDKHLSMGHVVKFLLDYYTKESQEESEYQCPNCNYLRPIYLYTKNNRRFRHCGDCGYVGYEDEFVRSK
uniref:Transposase n=2 Tax=viral metagenome TaxID=1070528 RepID=A0A6H1ZH46_9ZZZZ